MKNINAKTLKSMLLSASNNLYNHYPEIDALNVFPVPDGDTGMNMNLTLSSGAKEIQNRNDENVYDLIKAFSKGLLMGARGNSGVITSQIFRGFCNALEGQKNISSENLIKAFGEAKKVAYKAVIKPVEGTILTVCRESAELINEKCNGSDSVEKIFKTLIDEANSSLNRTPELLPVLKEVGVVDSGGKGYVTILEGMFAALIGEFIEKKVASSVDTVTKNVNAVPENQEFGYCTEFILQIEEKEGKKAFDKEKFINGMLSHGSSLELVKDEDIVKVHVHTLTPGWILTYSQQFGEFLTLKIENMTEEHKELIKAQDRKEETQEIKQYAIIACSAGDGIDAMFKEAGVDFIVSGGQTMNPSTEDFVDAINSCHAENIFILPNNSNIVMAASQACDVIDESINAQVIPSSTIPQGLAATFAFNPDSKPNENYRAMKSSLKSVKSASITYAIKDTEIEGVKVFKDQYMALVNKKIVACVSDKFEALKIALSSMIDDESSMVTIFIGSDLADSDVSKVQEMVESIYDLIDVDVRKGNQPVYSFIVGVE